MIKHNSRPVESCSWRRKLLNDGGLDEMDLRVGRNQTRQYFTPPSSVELLGPDSIINQHANFHPHQYEPSEPPSPSLTPFCCLHLQLFCLFTLLTEPHRSSGSFHQGS